MKATTLSKKLSAADALTAQIQQAQVMATPKNTAKPLIQKVKTAPLPTTNFGPLDPLILKDALREGFDDPRFCAVSTPAKCVLAYLNSTVPKFSTSAIVRRYVEAGLAAEYPELWAEVSRRDG